MDDIKILETCRVCGSPLTLMGSINEKGELWAVKRCLNCFSHPAEEVVQLMEAAVIERLAAAESRAEQAEAELATHKRALELVCRDRDWSCDDEGTRSWRDYYLAQAERGNDDARD